MGTHSHNFVRSCGFLLFTLIFVVVEILVAVDGENVTVRGGEDAVLPCMFDLDFLSDYGYRQRVPIDVQWSVSSGRGVCSCSGFFTLFRRYFSKIDCDCPGSRGRYSMSTETDSISELLDFSLTIRNTTFEDAAQYTCNARFDHNRFTEEFTHNVILDVMIIPDSGYPVCSVKSVGVSIDMTETTTKTTVRCESRGGYPSVTVRLVSETGFVVGKKSGFGNETIVVTYEFISSTEDAGKIFTCHVIQGNIVTASCDTEATAILDIYALKEPKLSDTLLFISAGHKKAKGTHFTWYINDVRASDKPGSFEIPTHSYYLLVHTVSTSINVNNFSVMCEATNGNGTASAQVTVIRTNESTTTIPTETVTSQIPTDSASPSSRPHLQKESILQSNGIIAGAFIGGVMFALFCFTVVVIAYRLRTGKQGEISRFPCCRNVGNDFTKTERRQDNFCKKGSMRTNPETNSKPYENIVMDTVVQETEASGYYTDLTKDKGESSYEKLQQGIMGKSKDREEVYEAV